MEREIPNQELLDKLRLGAETLRLESEDLLRRGEERRHEWESHMLAIKLIENVRLDAGEKARGAAAPANATDLDTRLSDLTVDFNGAQNTSERVRRIGVVAKANGRLLNTSEVTKYLLSTGHSRSNVKNMRPTIHRILKDQPEVYKTVAPGTFDFIQVDPHTQVEQPCPTSTGEASPDLTVGQGGYFGIPVPGENCEVEKEDEVEVT